jgi:anti-sigma B factor antagonist
MCKSDRVTVFSLTTSREGATTVLHIGGELDMATAPRLSATAHAELDRPDCRTLVFDVSGLDFVDSTGVGCWVEVRNRASAEDRQVLVRAANPVVARILEIGGLTRLFAEPEA